MRQAISWHRFRRCILGGRGLDVGHGGGALCATAVLLVQSIRVLLSMQPRCGVGGGGVCVALHKGSFQVGGCLTKGLGGGRGCPAGSWACMVHDEICCHVFTVHVRFLDRGIAYLRLRGLGATVLVHQVWPLTGEARCCTVAVSARHRSSWSVTHQHFSMSAALAHTVCAFGFTPHSLYL